MSILRMLGKIGLVLVALLMFVGIYLGVQDGKWLGVLLCTCFLVVLAAFYDVFRVEALREKRPYGSFSPSRIIHLLLFIVLGMGVVLGGIARLWVGSYLGGTTLLVIGLVVLSVAVDVFRGRT